jgi:hypothetical protein
MTTSYRPLAIAAVILGLTACSDSGYSEAEVYTLYSTNFPHDVGRHPVATFDVAATPELSLSICQETAELYKADFEKRKRDNAGNANWTNAKARYWCEKGRFKK